MKYIVTTERTTDYPKPICLKKGMVVRLGEMSTENKWNNWIKCVNGDISGWVPLQIVNRIDEMHGTILEDYTANELTVKKGDIIISEKEMNGWIFGYNENEKDIMGWVPKENVNNSI